MSTTQSASVTAPVTSIRWSGVSVTLLVIWIVSLIDKVTLGVFVADKQFVQAMGLAGKPAAIGLLLSSFLVGYGVATFGWGFVVDRLGARRILLWSMVIWGVLEILQGFAGNLQAMITLRVLHGLFEAAIWPATMVMTAKWFPMKERARAQSIWLNGINLGPVIGMALVAFLIMHLGWQQAFIVIGVLQLVVTLPMVWFLTAESPADHPRISVAERSYIEQEQAKDLRGEGGVVKLNQRSIREVFADNKVWLVLLTWLLDTIIFFTITSWFVKYMKDVRHLSLGAAGIFGSFSFVLAIVAMLLAGQLSDRWLHRRAPVSVVGYLLAALALYLAVHASTPMGAAVGLALTLAFKSMASTTASAMMHNSTGSLNLGTVIGIQVGPANLVSAFGPWFFGVLIALSGGFAAGFNGIAALFVVAAALCGLLWMQKQ